MMRNLRRIFLLLAVAFAVQAQTTTTTWDTSGNGQLNGTYYFRQLIYLVGDQYGDLSEAVSLYGNIVFDGNGGYKLTANNWYAYDSNQGPLTGPASGTYSISSSGYGFISNPYTGDPVYGMVSQQGIFTGSSTDNSIGYNDFMVAAPLASPLPTASTFSGTYVFSNVDMTLNWYYTNQVGTPGTSYNLGMTFTLTADGACHISPTTVTGYVGTSTTPTTQVVTSSPTCLFSNGAAVVTFPTNGSLMSGQKYLYFSKDGNFVFGGSPYTSASSPWDMIVGVKVGTGTPNLSGLFYQSGIDASTGDLDTFFGSFDDVGGGTILGHQRIEDVLFAPATTDYTYSSTYTVPTGSTYSTSTTKYTVGAGGAVRIGSGIGPFIGLSVALQAPSLSGTGVYLNPQGILNAASYAPFSAGIAPGELLTLYGTNLAPAGPPVRSDGPFPTTLDHVQVSIGGLPAPIFYVLPPGQLIVVVPYGVTPGTIANIQVTNNGTLSNVVPVFVNQSAPGVLTANQNGLGYGDAVKPDYSIVNASNPAKAGDVLQIYLTGLGAVTPSIMDGGLGPTDTLSQVAAGSVTSAIGGTAATVGYAGLAPGYSGLYQMNITVPTGLTTGDKFLFVSGPDAYNTESLVPIAAASSAQAPEAPAAQQTQVVNPKQSPGRTKVDPKATRGHNPTRAIGTSKQ
jgi:uncharacterized protein (TIGR03437 family)